jgi:zinc protease
MITRIATFAAIALGLTFSTGTAHAMKIQSVKSPGGIQAWLVEEHGLPLVTMQYGFMGGSSQDPAEKPGVANFISAMLDEGAGDILSADFQQQMETLAAKMRHEAGRDSFTGTFQTLTANREKAGDLLALALTKPRFDADALDRVRSQLLANLSFESKDPDKVAEQSWFETAFAGHPYGRPVDGTISTISGMKPADLKAYHDRVFARDNLKVAVVGDIDAATLGAFLDKVFGGLAAKAELVPVPQVDPQGGPAMHTVEMDIPQSVAQFGHIGMARKDPDFIAGYILNYIIGGGGFASRLMDEVREKRGLAYSVYSYILPLQRSSVYLGGVATKTDAMDKSLEVIRTQLEQVAKDGPRPEELADAKTYLTGSYALNFTSSGAISGQLLGIQMQDLPIDYTDTRNAQVEAVTMDDIRRVAKKLLQPGKLLVTVVGKGGDKMVQN